MNVKTMEGARPRVKGIERAVALAERLQHAFVATSNREGTPHIAAAASLSLAADNSLSVSSWFCPATVSNLQENRKVSVVVWNPETDEGLQAVGTVERIEETSILDGYAPERETAEPPPQVERRLIVDVEKVIAFSHAPHSDTEV
jgi:hypothetical protein